MTFETTGIGDEDDETTEQDTPQRPRSDFWARFWRSLTGQHRRQQREADVRAVAATLHWIRAEIPAHRKLLGAIHPGAWIELEDRFMDRIVELEARDAKDGAAAKFAADMDRLRKNDPTGAQWVEHILTEHAEQQPEDGDRG